MAGVLENRVALVTGASSGYGRALVNAFVRAGASVVATARSEALLQELRAEILPFLAPSRRCEIVVGDISRESHVDEIVRVALHSFGGVDILVNCAGVAGPRCALAALDDAAWREWRDAMEVNLLGPVYLCRRVIPHMKRGGKGKIINISGGGATRAIEKMSAYGASKSALIRFTETLALELAPEIDVNAIAPGVLNTALGRQVAELGPEVLGEGFYRDMAEQERGEVDALARAAACCVFLASAESDGITGRLISAKWDDWKTLPLYGDALCESDVYQLRRIVPAERPGIWRKDQP